MSLLNFPLPDAECRNKAIAEGDRTVCLYFQVSSREAQIVQLTGQVIACQLGVD